MVRSLVSRIAGVFGTLVAAAMPIAAQEATSGKAPRQVDVGVGYVRQACMNGMQATVTSPWKGRVAVEGEFAATFGPDCGSSRPRYRDFLFQGGVRWTWHAGPRTSVYVRTLAGLLHSTAGAYQWSYRSLVSGTNVIVGEPDFTLDYFALTAGGGLTTMFTPRYGLYAQVDSLTGIPNQSDWEGVSGFGRASAGLLVAAGRPFAPRQERTARPRRAPAAPGGVVVRERWDVAGVFGVTGDRDLERRRSERNRPLGSVAGGYYVTPHLKIDGRVMWPLRLSGLVHEDIEVPGLPGGGYQNTTVDVERQSTAVGVSWQFGTNTRVHPYVSAGVQVDREKWRRQRDAATHVGYYGPYPSVAVRYTVTALNERRSDVEFRPYVGGGTKVYIGSRFFTRGEWLWGSSSNLLSGGAGIDF